MVLLGSLVYFTGGAAASVFAPQFAAVLPMAVLIRDSARVKWAYAVVFLLVFLVSLQPMPQFSGYRPDGFAQKQLWFLVFFFLFTLFPVIYSIMVDKEFREDRVS